MKANAEEREGESRLKFQRYTLLQASWTELDKMLLEVFEEINNDHEADVMRTQVQIQAGYSEEIQNGKMERTRRLKVVRRATICRR